MPITSGVVRFALLVLLWLAAASTAWAQPAGGVRVGVITMLPGEIFWERFGHNAVVIDDPANSGPISYNFGFFDLDEPGFFRRFARGEMEYMLVALPLEQDLRYYREVGRGVTLQWLDLDPAQATRLAAELADNARPENARYRYDYFTDNCSTRVRDALDGALGGMLQAQMVARSQGNTYRSEAVRLASPAGWMWLGFDVGLGPFADRPLSRWQEAFVPMRLADSLREAKLADGRPLVVSETELVPHRIAPEPAEAPRRWWHWALAGAVLALGIVRLGTRSQRLLAAIALPLWTLCAGLGLTLAYLWCCTAHRAGWANHNLLLFSPLCLMLLPGAIAILRGRAPGAWFARWLLAVAVGALGALVLQLLPGAQYAAPWIGLLLPVHVAFAWVWARPRQFA